MIVGRDGVLGRRPYKTVPENWRGAVGEGWMAIVSVGVEPRISIENACRAAMWMLEHVEQAVFGYLSSGGLTEWAYRRRRK